MNRKYIKLINKVAGPHRVNRIEEFFIGIAITTLLLFMFLLAAYGSEYLIK